MASHASCCGKWITVSESGFGFLREFDCRGFLSDQSPDTEAQRRAICQQLFDGDSLCPEVAQFCEPFKDDLARERARKRDEAERRAVGAWPPKERSEDSAWETLHMALDGLGLLPALGIVPDAINAGIYSVEGDWPNAGISMAGMVEGLGQGATGTRLGVKISRKAILELGEGGLTKALRKAVDAGAKERVLRAGYSDLATRVDSYRRLKKETRAWNKGMRELYPGHRNPDLRLDAHHVFEARAFEKFKQDFADKGIKSAQDLPTIAIPYEGHLRSVEGMAPVFADAIARNVDEANAAGGQAKRIVTVTDESVRSLTEELKQAIDLRKYDSVEDVIKAYEDYYGRDAGWWDKVKPVFEDLRRTFGMPPLP